MILRALPWLLAGVAHAFSPTAATAESAAAEPSPGQQAFAELCVSCHGETGKGDGPVGQTAVPMPRDFSVGAFKFDADSDGHTGTDADLALVIRDGALAYGGNPLMAGWGNLGEARIAELVAYIRSLKRGP